MTTTSLSTRSKSNGQVIPAKLAALYDRRMNEVEDASNQIGSNLSRYWWNLIQCHDEESWRARFDSVRDWLGDLSKETWGPSVQGFYNVYNASQMWRAVGADDDTVAKLLGRKNMAITVDMRELFVKENGEWTPNQALLESGEDPLGFIERVADLPPGEARQEIGQLVDEDNIYVKRDTIKRVGNKLVFVVRHDRKGRMKGEWTVIASATHNKTQAKELPAEIADWLERQVSR